MEYYVGLNVGLEETGVCIVDRESKAVREVKVNTEPAVIRSALEGFADRLSRVSVEASSLGHWRYRELHASGLPIIVVEGRHMRVSLSTTRNKTDRNDARGIAQLIRLGWFRAIHVKNVEMQKMRTLLTNRKLRKRKLVDIENHIGWLRMVTKSNGKFPQDEQIFAHLPLSESDSCFGRHAAGSAIQRLMSDSCQPAPLLLILS